MFSKYVSNLELSNTSNTSSTLSSTAYDVDVLSLLLKDSRSPTANFYQMKPRLKG